MENQVPQKPLRLLSIISYIFLVVGILSIVVAALSIAEKLAAPSVSILFSEQFLYYLCVGIFFVVVALGLMKMKLWAVYAYMILVIVSIIFYEVMRAQGLVDSQNWSLLGYFIQIVLVIYFWSIRKQLR